MKLNKPELAFRKESLLGWPSIWIKKLNFSKGRFYADNILFEYFCV